MKLDIHYFLTAKYAKWMIISLISFLCLLIVNEYTKLFYPVIDTRQPVDTGKPLSPSMKQDSFNYILNSSLFGVYVSNDLNGDNVKKSMLNVTLVGIMLGNTVEESQVIIRSANGEEKNYKVDDKLPGGALIKRIMAHGVLVERDGALESLSLPKNDLTFEPVAKPLIKEE